MKYKGYTATIQYEQSANTFFGQVLNTKDIITFEGTSTQELEQAFQNSVDDYLDFCKEINQEPSKPFSGKLMVRLKPETHQMVSEKAAANDISINTFIEETLAHA